jgi:hypothetical protein
LLIDGTISTNRAKISERIAQFYKMLYTKQFIWRPLLDGLSFDSIDEVEASWLERNFEEKEVMEVVKAMNGDKTRGSDDFMTFFQACWVVLKEEVMKVFHDFHARGKFERSLNATFIALIPKILGVLTSRTFARLDLWRVFTKKKKMAVSNFFFFGPLAKIIAKILANKLKVVLEKIICKLQNALI